MSRIIAEVEQLAELFRRDTGMMAPGKDSPPEMGEPHTSEERRERYNEWMKASAFKVILDELLDTKEQLRRASDELEEAQLASGLVRNGLSRLLTEWRAREQKLLADLSAGDESASVPHDLISDCADDIAAVLTTLQATL